ncbi:DUF2156 domain-containing protein [candidate division TA06 bacterium]|nr:DUF2156 domain-containing protein [candidate division TA06 bacterium]
MDPLKQLIPSEICLKCQVCCRFPSPESDMFPVFMKEEMDHLSPEYRAFFDPVVDTPSKETTQKDGVFRPAAKSYPGESPQACACPFFNPVTHECAIYLDRPLDCQLYPFVVILSPTGKRVLLGLDTQCPFVQGLANQEPLIRYGEEVRRFLEETEITETMSRSPGFIGKGEETILPLYPLSRLTENFFHETLFGKRPPPSSGLIPLTLKDREILEPFFSRSPRLFADTSLISLFIFSDLLRFYWKKEKEVLLIVAEQGNHFFMPIPPVTEKLTANHIKESLDLLDRLNPKGTVSRIEGLSEEDLSLLEIPGGSIYPKNPEYLYRQSDLAELRGDTYKSKRALYNHFTKHYEFTYRPYHHKDFWECLHLFKMWQEKKLRQTNDSYEQALLEDAAFVHRQTLLQEPSLPLEGRIVKVGGAIKGYTFGYALNDQTWCILLEITDLETKGLAQYLFREFCREKKAFPVISGMDDAGLERLRKAKESYRPSLKKIPYVVSRTEV